MKTPGPARVVGTPWGPWLGFYLEGVPAYHWELGWRLGARRLCVAWGPSPNPVLCSGPTLGGIWTFWAGHHLAWGWPPSP